MSRKSNYRVLVPSPVMLILYVKGLYQLVYLLGIVPLIGLKSALKKRKDCLDKLDRKISRNCKKDQKLLEVREELAEEVRSYTKKCNEVEKTNLDKGCEPSKL